MTSVVKPGDKESFIRLFLLLDKNNDEMIDYKELIEHSKKNNIEENVARVMYTFIFTFI